MGFEGQHVLLVTAYADQKNWMLYSILRQSPQAKRAIKRPKKIDLGHAVKVEFVSNSSRSPMFVSLSNAYGHQRFDIDGLKDLENVADW